MKKSGSGASGVTKKKATTKKDTSMNSTMEDSQNTTNPALNNSASYTFNVVD